MVQGSADPLVSAFHLSFNMVLNLCRTESGDPEALMRASYRQYQTELALPSLRKRVKELKDRCKFLIENEDKLEESFLVLQKIGQLHVEMRKLLQNPEILLTFLQPGRLVRVLARNLLNMEHYLSSKEYSIQNSLEESDIEKESMNLVERITKMDESVWGCVVNFKKVSTRNGPTFQVDVLVGTSGKDATFSLQKSTAENAKPKVVTFDLARIDALSKVRMYLPPDLRSLHARQKLQGAIREVEVRFAGDTIPVLDPEEDMRLDDKEYRKVCRKLESLEDMAGDHQELEESELKEGYKLICKKSILKSMANAAKRESSASNSLVGKEELKARRRMLRKLDYVDSNQIVQTKGHIAAEISSADELVLTELLVNGTFKNLPHDQTVALLSCFVHSEKSSLAFDSESTSLLEEHFQLFSKLREQVRRIGSVAKDMRLNIDMEKYLDSFSPQLMEASGAWARGSNFSTILKMSKVFEGSLVRAIRRVDELLQQLIAACKSIGENEQADHFSQCSDQIKKDVVFAASLYL
jgi:ATP-dependent RNA helicase DOB1